MNFTLQPYAGMQSRYKCPACNHRTKTFTRYIDTDTSEDIAPHVGKCDRLDKCGYHLKPGEYFKQVGSTQFVPRSNRQASNRKQQSRSKANIDPDYFIHPEYVNQSFVNYDRNNFVQFLIGKFGLDIADKLVAKYRIGTSDYWHGATIFWQLDSTGHVRSGKIMLYNKSTGKRVKQPFNHITWAHTLLVRGSGGEGREAGNHEPGATQHEPFILNQCLFGEHLLITSPFKPVAVVESEKTAIIASALMPAFIWLACGSLDGLSYNKCCILQGRQVTLFPDVNAFSRWKIKALELRRAMPGTMFTVSPELERLATADDKQKGIDIGDVLA
jgi:Domain of unknown function (DUF6371)